MKNYFLCIVSLLLLAHAGSEAAGLLDRPSEDSAMTPYIVSADSLASARESVQDVNGIITEELGAIDAVAATLSPQQVATLDSPVSAVTLFADKANSNSDHARPESLPRRQAISYGLPHRNDGAHHAHDKDGYSNQPPIAQCLYNHAGPTDFKKRRRG